MAARTKALLLLVAVALTHYGYKPLSIWLHDSEWQRASNWFYALRGMEGTVLAALLLAYFRSAGIWLGVFACWVCIGEEAQTAVCGVAWMGGGDRPTVPELSSLCIAEFGRRGYVIAASALWATLALLAWRDGNEQEFRASLRRFRDGCRAGARRVVIASRCVIGRVSQALRAYRERGP